MWLWCPRRPALWVSLGPRGSMAVVPSCGRPMLVGRPSRRTAWPTPFRMPGIGALFTRPRVTGCSITIPARWLWLVVPRPIAIASRWFAGSNGPAPLPTALPADASGPPRPACSTGPHISSGFTGLGSCAWIPMLAARAPLTTAAVVAPRVPLTLGLRPTRLTRLLRRIPHPSVGEPLQDDIGVGATELLHCRQQIRLLLRTKRGRRVVDENGPVCKAWRHGGLSVAQ